MEGLELQGLQGAEGVSGGVGMGRCKQAPAMAVCNKKVNRNLCTVCG